MTEKERGELSLNSSIVITPDYMKGVHDAQFVIVNDKAYIVYEANDVQCGENPTWDFVYCAMTVVDVASTSVEKTYKISYSEQAFSNMTLQKGCTFVPRIVKIDDDTLRIFFTSEAPSVRPSRCYYRDFHLKDDSLSDEIGVFSLKTSLGMGDFNNKRLFDAATRAGVPARDNIAPFLDCCAFIFDIFYMDGQAFAIVNAFWTGINAIGKFSPDFTFIEIIGFYGEHTDHFRTTESGVVKTPLGKWLAILREDTKFNYMFAESDDGITWRRAHYSPLITNGASSKPILVRLGEYYYLGYNHSDSDKPTTLRNHFTFLRSTDCSNWEKYAVIDSDSSFQYPYLLEYGGKIYFSATQGDKEQIIFGELKQ